MRNDLWMSQRVHESCEFTFESWIHIWVMNSHVSHDCKTWVMTYEWVNVRMSHVSNVKSQFLVTSSHVNSKMWIRLIMWIHIWDVTLRHVSNVKMSSHVHSHMWIHIIIAEFTFESWHHYTSSHLRNVSKSFLNCEFT